MANRKIGQAEWARRRRIVGQWRRGGESAAKFARRLGVSRSALYAWARQAEPADRPAADTAQSRGSRSGPGTPGPLVDFVPVQLVSDEGRRSADGGFVEIQLRGGELVRVVGEVSTERVGAVLAAVRQAC